MLRLSLLTEISLEPWVWKHYFFENLSWLVFFPGYRKCCPVVASTITRPFPSLALLPTPPSPLPLAADPSCFLLLWPALVATPFLLYCRPLPSLPTLVAHPLLLYCRHQPLPLLLYCFTCVPSLVNTLKIRILSCLPVNSPIIHMSIRLLIKGLMKLLMVLNLGNPLIISL